MSNKPKTINETFKKSVVDAFLERKELVLSDFREDQQRKLDSASSDDSDSRHIDSKNEETLSELDFLNKNIDILEKEIVHLREIPERDSSIQVAFGSLVQTDHALVLVGAAQENMEIGGRDVVGISMASPLFKSMEGKRIGEKAEVNGVIHSIKTVV